MSALRLAFLDVGQGDTTIIYDPILKEAVVVDCVDFISVIDFLLSENIKRVRAVILTHLHSDHYSGIMPFFDNCERYGITWDTWILKWCKGCEKRIDLLEDSDGHSEMVDNPRQKIVHERKTSNFQSLLRCIKTSGINDKIKEPSEVAKDVPILVSMSFLYPQGRHVPLFASSNLNNLSLIIRISCESKALLTGDIEPDGWQELRSSCLEHLPSDILKFPHHGAWNGGQVSQILDDVNPGFVVISVGTYNNYNHPNQAVFAEISRRSHIRLLCTQATPQCNSRIETARNEVLKTMKGENEFRASLSEHSHNCPCAGTVIIELGETAKVLSPSPQLHVEQIIKTYMDSHKCSC
ncbi:MAG: ComEC/Rec2 family competence protein [bacterium]